MPAPTPNAVLLTDQATNAADAGFRARVGQALPAVALAVIAEDTATANHAGRAAFAQSVLRGQWPQGAAATAAAAATDGTGPTTTDADLLTRVWNLWDSLSG